MTMARGAKTRLSQRVARAERGERITIARDDRPVAELAQTRRRGREASVPDDDPLLNLASFALDGPPPSRPLTDEEIDESIYGT